MRKQSICILIIKNEKRCDLCCKSTREEAHDELLDKIVSKKISKWTKAIMNQ